MASVSRLPCPNCKNLKHPKDSCGICNGNGYYEVTLDAGEPSPKVERQPGAGYNGIPDPNDDMFDANGIKVIPVKVDNSKPGPQDAGLTADEMIDWSKHIDPNNQRRG